MFLCYGASGGDDLSEVRPYAVGSELIHTATLLHDDVIDEGDVRRGEPTANSVYGKVNAVLSGDYLVAHVINELHQLEYKKPVEKLSEVMTRLIQGEILQDELSGNPEMNQEQYLRIVRLKTSSLFTYSAWCGGYLPDQNENRAETFSNYAENLGIAFQMIDDVLDYQSGESGKTPLADLRDGTINFPLLMAFRDDPDLRRRFHRTNFEEDPDPEFLEEIRRTLRDVEALDRTREVAREYSSRARACIGEIDSNSFIVALEQLADYVFRRIQ
jgi:octaprenyl-diphosphate synthase